MNAQQIRQETDQKIAELDARWEAAKTEHDELLEKLRSLPVSSAESESN